MSDREEKVLQVPWNSSRWERAILQRKDIARLGGAGDFVLYRPSRLVVEARAAADKRVQDLLKRNRAERHDGAPDEVAKALGLELFVVPDDRLVKTVQQIRSIVGQSASLDHVLLPGPNRIHGDDDPEPIENPGDVPGTGAAGEGCTVLVLDTGFVGTKPQPFPVQMGPLDAEIPDDAPVDGLRDPAAGHGTHVAGIVASIAPGATIIAKRLMTTPVGQCSDLDLAAALLDAKADLINCSFGSTSLGDAPPLIVERALARLARGTLVVAAAGNAGLPRVNWPAAANGVLAVGSVGCDGGGEWLQTDFSNHGIWVDCCAPGVAIRSTFVQFPAQGFKGYASWTGTSMSCPAVTGSIAAYSSQAKISVTEASQKLLQGRRIGDVGALVDPANLP